MSGPSTPDITPPTIDVIRPTGQEQRAIVAAQVEKPIQPSWQAEIAQMEQCLSGDPTIPGVEKTFSFLAGFSGRKLIDAQREELIEQTQSKSKLTSGKEKREEQKRVNEAKAKLKRFDKLLVKLGEKQSKIDIDVLRLQGNKEDTSASASTLQEQALGFDIETMQLETAQVFLTKTMANLKKLESQYLAAGHQSAPKNVTNQMQYIEQRLQNVEKRQSEINTERKKLSDADPKLKVNQVKVVALGIAKAVSGEAQIPDAVQQKIVSDPAGYLEDVIVGAVENPAQMAQLQAAGIVNEQSAQDLIEAVHMLKEEKEIIRDERKEALEKTGNKAKTVAGMAGILTFLFAYIAMQKSRRGGGGGG